MGDAVQISGRVPSTCVQTAIVPLLIIYNIPIGQIYVVIDNTLLNPSVSCLTTSSYLWNDVRTADGVSHTDHFDR